MQFTEVKSEGLKKEYKVIVPKTHLDKRLNERLMSLGETAKIPGFRPGKAPLPILKQRYGKSVQGEVLEKSVQESIAELVKEKKVKPALRPDVKIDSFDEKKDLELTVSLEVMPDFDAPEIEKLTFERLACEPTAAELKESLTRIASGNAISEDIKKPRASKKGDVLIIDFEGSVDGELFKGGTAKGVSLELGSGSFIPGFEDQLIGKKADDDVEVKVTFPKDYHEKTLAGKEALFKTKVNKIQEKIVPEVNDEFAKKLGLESAEKLEDAVKKQLSDERNQMSFLVSKRSVLDTLADKTKFEVPDGLVEAEFETIWKQYESQLGGDNDENSKANKPTKKELEADKKQYRDIAERRVRLGLVLAEIGRQYEVTVTSKELDQAIIETARRYPGQERQVVEHFKGNDQALANLRAPIFEDKVIRLILDKAKTKDKKTSLDDLTAAVKAVTEGEE